MTAIYRKEALRRRPIVDDDRRSAGGTAAIERKHLHLCPPAALFVVVTEA